MPLLIKDVISRIESIIPLYLQEEWDNSGYQIKSSNNPVSGIVTSLDLTTGCSKLAVNNGANLIFTHHPPFFNPVEMINLESPTGKIAGFLSGMNVCVYSLHTNFDSSIYGMSRFIGLKIGIKDLIPIANKKRKLFKLSVFIPEGHVEKVRDALFASVRPVIGNYENCSYEVKGRGSFKPLSGAKPFIGSKGKTSFVDESRLELLVPEEKLEDAIKELKRVHPYEEVAFDVYTLHDSGGNNKEGHGVMGDMDPAIKFSELLGVIQKSLNPSYINYTGDLKRRVKRIGIVAGSGFSFVDEAFRKGCDALISSELKHSEALKAVEYRICLASLSHFDTEKYFTGILKDILLKEFKGIGIFENKEKGPVFTYNKYKEAQV